ncbi:uncharacterized protein Tco025E_03145 [Trypanosoma conorhini]|uniref:Uncharacterized protein n=1 Tax=Trypanosoma conorhini TaxID=83891 RepID=A0A3R7NS23_9TRYP|nr:uncharacterized protein Tco025E_03145 [Trypanosoma conorhini]RNF22574.1 hypothetical protein Tco025E_03145 [Trypanosoma conorhini]
MTSRDHRADIQWSTRPAWLSGAMCSTPMEAWRPCLTIRSQHMLHKEVYAIPRAVCTSLGWRTCATMTLSLSPVPQPYVPKEEFGQLRRENSVLLSRRGSRMGSFRYEGAPSGSFSRSSSFQGSLNARQYGSFSSYGSGYRPPLYGFPQSNGFQRSNSAMSGFGSGYGNSFGSRVPSALLPSNRGLSRNNSGLNPNYSFGSALADMNYGNGAEGLRQHPSRGNVSEVPVPQPEADPGLARKNSMTLTRQHSTLNGFYEFGPLARAGRRMGGAGALEEARLAARPTAPPQWPSGSVSVMAAAALRGAGNGGRPGRAPEWGTREPPKQQQPPNAGELARKGSEKRIGMYFKDVQPTQDGEYKKEGDLGSARNPRNLDPPMMTHVRTILLLEKKGGDTITVDGSTAIVEKPGTDELQKFDTNEIVQFSPDDSIVFIETLEEMRDNFLLGCNVGLVMADSNCPAHDPAKWFSWNVVKQLVKDVFPKMKTRTELSVSVSILEDDQVMDLLTERPHHAALTVAQSPLFGNVAHGVIYQLVEDASEFSALLDLALSRSAGKPGEERGIVLMSAILKQIRTHTPHTKGDEEDIVLSSLFVTCVGDGIVHYNRIVDKNPAEPRAMFQFVLGGPSMTAAVISVVDEPSNASAVSQCLTTLQRLGEIQNYSLRLGSVRRFIKYTNEVIPKTRRRLAELEEGREKAATQRSLARLELMVSDAEAMLESPETAAPKMYIRQ